MKGKWLAGLALVALFGVGIYEANFYKAHFGRHVYINDVNVSKMTKSQALSAVNQAAPHTWVLIDHRVMEQSKINQKFKFNMTDMDQMFNEQYQVLGSNKIYHMGNRASDNTKAKLQSFNHRQVNLTLAGKKYTMDANDLADGVTYQNGHYRLQGKGKGYQLVSQINEKVGTNNKTYPITLPNHQKINVTNKSYGWQLKTASLTKALQAGLLAGNNPTIDGDKYVTGTGYTNVNQGLGHNYVVVSIKDQKLWVVENDKVAVTLDDVVTGTADKNKDDATPVGVWYVLYKQSPSTLKGTNDDGSPYSSKVQYWVPFTQSGCGLHDASWRQDWSKKAYLEGGSHGCVNIKPSQMKQVYDHVHENEAVVVY